MNDKIISNYNYTEFINEEGPFVYGGLNMQAHDVKTLGEIKEVSGTVFLRSDSLEDLGDLRYIDGDLIIADCPKLTNLKPLIEVTGTVNLSRSNIDSLGSLKFVGVRLNLKGKPNIDFSNLTDVGCIYLSKQLKPIELKFKYDKVSYFKDPIEETSQLVLNSVGAEGYYWHVISLIDYEKRNSHLTRSNLIIHYWVRANKYVVAFSKYDNTTNKQSPYYKAQSVLEQEEKEYEKWKQKIHKDQSAVLNMRPSKNLNGLRMRLFYDLFKDLAENSITENEGLKRVIYYKNAFNPKYYTGYDLKTILLKEGLIIDQNSSLSKVLNFGELHTLERKLKKGLLDSSKLINWKGTLSNHTKSNYDDFLAFTDAKIEHIYNNSYSFMEVLFNVNDSVSEINEEFKELKKQYKSSIGSNWYGGSKKFEQFLQDNIDSYPLSKYLKPAKLIAEKKQAHLDLLYWHKPYHENIFDVDKSGEGFIIFIECLIEKMFFLTFIGLENEFRELKGLPRIGEGWISETELYYKIKETFNDFEVVHHGKPEWLGRQHVDIYFPKHVLGIEYQGAQHDKPIEFFGGEEAFKKNQIRDERKRKLFKENNATLIEVRPDYDFEEVKKQILKILNKNSKA
jgi:hypothetical protein